MTAQEKGADHTPLPWVVETDQIVSSDPDCIADIICDAPPRKYESRKNWEANFALIVRAVNAHAELVGALKEIRHMWAGHAEECRYITSNYKSKCDCDWPKIAERCATALAKAGA